MEFVGSAIWKPEKMNSFLSISFYIHLAQYSAFQSRSAKNQRIRGTFLFCLKINFDAINADIFSKILVRELKFYLHWNGNGVNFINESLDLWFYGFNQLKLEIIILQMFIDWGVHSEAFLIIIFNQQHHSTLDAVFFTLSTHTQHYVFISMN